MSDMQLCSVNVHFVEVSTDDLASLGVYGKSVFNGHVFHFLVSPSRVPVLCDDMWKFFKQTAEEGRYRD